MMLLRFVVILFLSVSCWALQATPGSECASVCIDLQSYNASSPASYTTVPDDLTCSDAAYNTTSSSEKFEKCVSCLQNSTAVDGDVNDVGAFLNNLRMTITSCLWGFPCNSSLKLETPCAVDSACGGIQYALQAGDLETTSRDSTAYCNAANNSFQSTQLSHCISCFQATPDNTYLANFLIALDAGCTQNLTFKKTVSLSGSPFTSTAIQATTPSNITINNSTSHSKTLRTGSIIGIVFAGILILSSIAAMLLIRRRSQARRNTLPFKSLDSDYDERYGASNITYPNSDSFTTAACGRAKPLPGLETGSEMHRQSYIASIQQTNPNASVAAMPLGALPPVAKGIERYEQKRAVRDSTSAWSETESDSTSQPALGTILLRGKARPQMLPRIQTIPEER